MSTDPKVDYRTEPSRYRHWRLACDGPIATLTMDIAEDGGIRDGYNGLLMPEEYPQGGLIPLTRESVAGITHLGGTILGTTNRGNPTCFPITQPDGSVVEVDRSDELVQKFVDAGLDEGDGEAATPGA